MEIVKGLTWDSFLEEKIHVLLEKPAAIKKEELGRMLAEREKHCGWLLEKARRIRGDFSRVHRQR